MVIHLKINFGHASSSLSKIHFKVDDYNENEIGMTSKMKQETVVNCIFHKRFHFSFVLKILQSPLVTFMIDNAPCSAYEIMYENISIYEITGCVRGVRILTSNFLFPWSDRRSSSSFLQFLSGQQKFWMLAFRNSSPILLLKS